jgi:hypothetical protein
VCQLYGAAFTNDAQSCQTIADSCVTETANGTNANFKTEDFDYAALLHRSDTRSGFASCALTIGEDEACLSDRVLANLPMACAPGGLGRGALRHARAQSLPFFAALV